MLDSRHHNKANTARKQVHKFSGFPAYIKVMLSLYLVYEVCKSIMFKKTMDTP